MKKQLHLGGAKLKEGKNLGRNMLLTILFAASLLSETLAQHIGPDMQKDIQKHITTLKKQGIGVDIDVDSMIQAFTNVNPLEKYFNDHPERASKEKIEPLLRQYDFFKDHGEETEKDVLFIFSNDDIQYHFFTLKIKKNDTNGISFAYPDINTAIEYNFEVDTEVFYKFYLKLVRTFAEKESILKWDYGTSSYIFHKNHKKAPNSRNTGIKRI